MTKLLCSLFAVSILLASAESHAMGRKKMHVAELKGVTESQVNSQALKSEGKATIMVRGKAAELVYRMIQKEKSIKLESDALKLAAAKGVEHTFVKGRQVTCSKISNQKRKQDDYACSFDIKHDGTVWAGGEAFNPENFNLARTETGSKLFKKSQSRGLASAAASSATYSTSQAFLVYDDPGRKKKSENTLIIFRGESAKEIMGLLETNVANRAAKWGESRGRKGADIACVNATAKEPERCALVVSFLDGSITRSGNPLFR